MLYSEDTVVLTHFSITEEYGTRAVLVRRASTNIQAYGHIVHPLEQVGNEVFVLSHFLVEIYFNVITLRTSGKSITYIIHESEMTNTSQNALQRRAKIRTGMRKVECF